MHTLTTTFELPEDRWRTTVRTLAAGSALFVALVAVSTFMEKAAHADAVRDFSARLPAVATVSFRADPVRWSVLLRSSLVFWGTWALLTPGIIWAARAIRARHPVLRIVVWIGLAVSACVAHAFISGLFTPEGPGGAKRGAEVNAFFGALLQQGNGSAELNVVAFGLIAGAVHALLYYRESQARRYRQAELETRLARSELDVLRMQLQPHFFFNTLHTVSALMVNDVPAARRVLASLGELVRQSMDQSGRQEITLREELEFTVRYIEIQRARFGEKLQVDIDVPEPLLRALVPNLLLQPLVENAIRHGIEPHAGSGTVSVGARQVGSELTIRVNNRRFGSVAPAPAPRAGRSGLGLSNLANRLKQLYPNAHRFEHGAHEHGYDVTLTIPFRQ